MPQAIVLERENPFTGKPMAYRLSNPTGQGGVAPMNAITPSATAVKVRLKVSGCSQITARARGTIVGAGGVTIQLYPMLADAGMDDTKGTRSGFRDDGTAVPAAVALVTVVENVVKLALAGCDYVELEIAPGAATTFDPTTANSFIDVFAN
jgi:hypothetical protein